MRLIIVLLSLATLCPAQDTIQLQVMEQGVTYTKFRLTNNTLFATFPGETHLVEIGQASIHTDEIGVIPGHQIWGFDSTFCYRIISLQYDIAIEINMPKVGISLQYGNPSLLYLMPEPSDITAFKQSWAIRRANEAREILLKEFSKRFNCSQGYRPSPMPVYDTTCQRL